MQHMQFCEEFLVWLDHRKEMDFNRVIKETRKFK